MTLCHAVEFPPQGRLKRPESRTCCAVGFRHFASANVAIPATRGLLGKLPPSGTPPLWSWSVFVLTCSLVNPMSGEWAAYC